jgi:two-component sensor histidine kinase/PAS domain-containing protein
VGGLALTVGLIVAVALLRMAVGVFSPTVTPYAGFYLAVLAATVLCGWRFGLLAVLLGGVTAWVLFLAPLSHQAPFRVAAPFSLVVYAISGVVIVAGAEYLQRLIKRLQDSRGALIERNAHYDTLFETMFEGFALCEAIWDEEGRLADYVILEINPALRRMLGVGSEVVGSRYSEGNEDGHAWLALCGKVMRSGEPESFEFRPPAVDRVYEIRISRINENRMAQFFFDVTDRKAAEARQAQMFEELNHRVKNNLTLVAGLLQLQARGAEPTVRDQLTKAVDRVQSVAQVHEALYRGSRHNDVDFGTYLTDLCASLSRSLATDGRIELKVAAEPVDLPLDTVIPLGMVVNELVTNAIKHAYPPPQTGLVSVSFKGDGELFRLVIEDGGCGLPEPSRAIVGGLGMTLVNSLVGQVQGKMAVRHKPGAAFEITFPAVPAEESVGGDRRLL